MSERTYRREDLEASRLAWSDLRLDSSWDSVRRLAGERGMIFPPTGTRWDDWTDPMPTQFAIIARAHRDTPTTLLSTISVCRSWSQVVAKVIHDRDQRAEDADLEEREVAWEKASEITDRQAIERFGAIVARVRDSIP